MPKKSKKSKKLTKKHEKKHKKHKKKYSDTSSSESESNSSNSPLSSEDTWVERKCGNPVTQKREDWMSDTSFVPTYSLHELKKEKEKKKKQEDENLLDKPGQSGRELNPYWRDGGSGLPENLAQGVRLASHTVGDQGAEWLRKALRRAEEQAKEEQRSLESVAAERYGSLENLHRMIREAEARKSDSRRNSRHRDHDRHYGSGTSRKDGFMKPSEDGTRSYDAFHSDSSRSSRPSWRKPVKPINERNERRERSEESGEAVGTEFTPGTSSLEQRKKREEPEERKSEFTTTKETETLPLTDEEMNSLASKILKAEIMGKTSLVRELTEKLENARKFRDSAKQTNAGDNVIVLTGTNARGYTQPVRGRTNPEVVKKRKTYETHADGKRVRYFEDDEKYSLTEMFEREQMKSAADSNAEFIQLSSKSKADKDYDIDDLFMEQTTSNRNKKEKDMQKAIDKQKSTERALDNCKWCLTNNKLQKHLIIATGSKCYLSIPYFRSLTENHCLIAPIYHSTCTTLLDEDVWDEIVNYCKTLVRMFRDIDHDVVFFENAMNFKYYPHMVIHCVPIPYESGNLAPIYFKKAILECEKEWAQNKKLVDFNKMDVKRVIPKGLPYFMVHFGMDNGFAHVIEDEKYFPTNFAQEVIGGMLDLDHRIWRKQHADDFETQCKKVNTFKNLWKTVS